MKNRISIIAIVSMVLMLAGCSTSHETLPGIDLPAEEMNQDIRLIANPGGGCTFKNDEYLDFQIENLTDTPIIFSGDYGVKIFTQKDTDWVEVENARGYPSTEYWLLPPKDDPFGQVVVITPSFLEIQEPTTIRVVVIGHREEDPDYLVGAYSDVTIYPSKPYTDRRHDG